MPQSRKPDIVNSPVEHSGTLLETDDDIRRALVAELKEAAQVVAERPALPFRPSARPPMALLTVFDDGAAEGETVRIRNSRFIIGRTHGDVRIPFDKRMSSRHVEITCQQVGGAPRWVVTDLQSRHGLFVRVSRALLAHNAEILVGGGRYRFEAPAPAPQETGHGLPADGDSADTQSLTARAGPFRPPALTEVCGKELGNRVVLVKQEYWIGSDLSCAICRPDDLFCDARHTRVYRHQKGSWHAEHNKSQNGLWLRVPQVSVETMIQFQLGEQRFRLKVE